MPDLYIITGSNGAGKSSIGPDYLPPHIRHQGPVFDADKLFIEKRNELWRTIKAPKECRNQAMDFVQKEFETLVDNSLANNIHFAYEGHFRDEETWNIPRRFREAGYFIHLIFLGLRDTDLSSLRVFDRTMEGGHNVPPYEVELNFYGNLKKLNQHFSLFHSLQIVDTSEAEHQVLAIINEGEPVHAVPADILPYWFQSQLPAITQKIRDKEPKFL
jgi:predicted ABC-type ATPase